MVGQLQQDAEANMNSSEARKRRSNVTIVDAVL